MKSFLYALMLLAASCSFSQNLIPNGDWEDGPAISTDFSDGWAVNGPDDWIATNISPDRIYAGDPTDFRDCDPAQSGSAYVMFYGPYNEAGKCTLLSPLEPGTKYHLTYWLDVDENFDGGPGAIWFNFNEGDSVLSPYVVNTGDWQFFDTAFVAEFADTELELVGEGLNLTKIDKIILSEGVAQGLNSVAGNSVVNIYPNPSDGNFIISGNTNMYSILQIFNVSGKSIYLQELPADGKIMIGDISPGIYFLKISNEKSSETGKITVIRN